MGGTRRAAIFDMDLTLVRVNSARLWMEHQVKSGKASRADMLRMGWWLAQYKLGVLDLETLARTLALPMRGKEAGAVRDEIRAWSERNVLVHASGAARDEVARRAREGWVCAMLTSSTRYAAEPVAESFGIPHVLASALVEDESGAFTGAPVEPLPYGRGKVRVAERWAEENDVDLSKSAFFTDSVSDLPLLERVREPVTVNADPRLWWIARRRGWPMLRW